MKKNISLTIMLFVICEALIIGLFQFAPCYSTITGRPNFFYVWEQEIHALWLTIACALTVLAYLFKLI